MGHTFAYILVVLTILISETVAVVKQCNATKPCTDGMLFPAWRPVEGISLGDKIGRAICYFVSLCYMFLGVSIVADRFMAAIEVITSQEREITVKKSSGEIFTVTVRIWNETVSNLTLMALGSSAPEILLSIIEVCGNNFKSGDLGPNTIVGSAAFNLFMIIAICVYVVPSNEIRRQQHLRVFMVTATWSIFAYVWLYFIIAVTSPREIEIWEGLVTFIFFPVTVGTAYIADRRLFPYKILPRKLRPASKKVAKDGDVELPNSDGHAGYNLIPQDDVDPGVKAFEEHRREFMEIFRELRRQNPDADIDNLQQMAEYEMLNRGPKSRAFYRVQATRRLMGGGNVIKKKLEREHNKSMEALAMKEAEEINLTAKVGFDPIHYTVLENIGKFDLTVTREGGPPDITILVDYHTEDGTANAGSDYFPVKGTLTLFSDMRHATISIEIVDDDIFEEDEHFYVHLTNLRVQTRDGLQLDPKKLGGMPLAELVQPSTATVMILDDDHAGVFSFETKEMEVHESEGHVHLKIMRHSGARGCVTIPYKTIDGTAVGDKDYEAKTGEVEFLNDEVEKYITIGIVDDQDYEKTETFQVALGEAIWSKKLSDGTKVRERYLRRQKKKAAMGMGTLSVDEASRRGSIISDKSDISGLSLDKASEQSEAVKIAELGRPRLGDITTITIKIKESKEFKNVVDKMIKTANVSLVLGTSSWREQFIDAITVSAGDDNGDDEDGGGDGGDEDREEPLPSCSDYLMHFICVPWKVLFAFIPPTDYLDGWLCFVVSILVIGLLTAVIGDLATHFGCSIGLRDMVTAISFVALGTSIPDTFASKVAAIQDKYADSSIGNVTGSNGVNVFLGIGIAWSIAAIYHKIVGTPEGFEVDPGSLAYSVVIFCVEAVVCVIVLLLRRHPVVGGELGGPDKFKYPTVILLVSLWFIYVIMSALESYCIVEGF